jgi:hypothetical protein
MLNVLAKLNQRTSRPNDKKLFTCFSSIDEFIEAGLKFLKGNFFSHSIRTKSLFARVSQS